jgi:hypothetical protein
MPKSTSMRDDNSGLTVKINFWSLEKYMDQHDALSASLWLRGQVTHAKTRQVKKFQNPGELLTILSKWNAEQFKDLKRKSGT